jgi:hypothetical protein
MRLIVVWILLVITLLEANAQIVENKLFQYQSGEITGIHFENKVNESLNRNIGVYDYMYNGAGVAIGDLNNDGLPDLFFCGNDVPNKLYLNKGDFVFEDVSEKSGITGNKWATGVTLVDLNGDGWLDIYVCYSGPDYQTASTSNELFINQKDGTFKEEAAVWGINDSSLSSQAVFFDMDGDGDLDLFVLNHAIRNWANQAVDWFKQVERIPDTEISKYSNTLFRNNGNGSFTDVTTDAGLNAIGFGLGVSIMDFDGNGLPDIYVANDYFIPDWLYLNQGNGKFVESLGKKFQHTTFFSMGCDAADINNDGLIDLAVLDMTPSDHYRNKTLMASMNTAEFDFLTKAKGFVPQYMFNSLYINSGNGIMSDIAHLAGVASTDWSWAPLLADFNNDRLKDLYVTNGFLRDVNNNDWRMDLLKMIQNQQLTKEWYFNHLLKAESKPVRNEMFLNADGYQFQKVSENWGLDKTSFSNGAAYGDLDGDGDLDLVVNNINQPAFIIKNNSQETTKTNFIRFNISDSTQLNLHVGATVTIHYKNELQTAVNSFTRGYQSFVEPVIHFGLGSINQVDRVVVKWSDGSLVMVEKPEINKVHFISASAPKLYEPANIQNEKQFWDISDLAIKPAAKHLENNFNDFQKEVLLPHKMSQLGPATAVGDVNADGLDDFFLGGAKGQSGMLYLQDTNGYFAPIEQRAFDENRTKEEIGALFFDSNGDGFLDLYVAMAGNGFESDKSVLHDVLYLNDGKGNFMQSAALPKIESSTKTIKAFDWDGDGDLDLFIGGRVESGRYPTSPRSYLLENRNGVFVDVTGNLAPQIERIGMVTDAEFASIDSKNRLFLVGEWMPVTCFEWNGNQFIPCSDFQFPNSTGWWNSISIADLTGNGRPDLLLGNFGRNNKFHPSSEKPLHLFANDMDGNGTLDIVLSKHYDNKLVPVRGKECSTQQMPFLANKFESYHEFASSSMIDIYGQKKLDESISLSVENFSSMWVENTSIGWKWHELPVEAQISPIQSFVVDDFDNDGIVDIVLAGNNFPTEVETTPYNSGKGLLLKGTGKGNFKALHEVKSGIFLPGDVRNLLPISISSDAIPGIIVTNNNNKVRLLMLNETK